MISIIIPLYNEERTIKKVLTDTLGLNFDKEIIVVDDASQDSSVSIVEEFKRENPKEKIFILKNNKNMGKGFCIKEGLRMSSGNYTVIQDADLEYNPIDLEKLLNYSKDYKAVFGKRNYLKGYMHYRLGSYILNKILNLLFKSNLNDFYTCYKLIKTDIFKTLPLEENGFGIETEITVGLLKKKIPIIEVPIEYTPRSFKEGKKIRAIDGIHSLKLILKSFFESWM